MSPRATTFRPDAIVFGLWLVFDDAGGVRLTRTQPGCDRRERAMFLEATLPKSLWRTPSLKATLTFPEGTQPAEIRLNVEGLSSAVKSAIGLDVDLKINTPET